MTKRTAIVTPKEPFTIDDMIEHEVLLERYEWLSAQILTHWRNCGAVRYFRGREGKLVYPLIDIRWAVTVELNQSIEGE